MVHGMEISHKRKYTVLPAITIQKIRRKRHSYNNSVIVSIPYALPVTFCKRINNNKMTQWIR